MTAGTVEDIAALRERLTELVERVAEIHAWQRQEDQNEKRFWAMDWPKVAAAMDRVVALERELLTVKPLMDLVQKQLGDHETRLRAVETSSLKMNATAAVVAALIGLVVPSIFKLLAP